MGAEAGMGGGMAPPREAPLMREGFRL